MYRLHKYKSSTDQFLWKYSVTSRHLSSRRYCSNLCHLYQICHIHLLGVYLHFSVA